jgi:hypothetical protein
MSDAPSESPIKAEIDAFLDDLDTRRSWYIVQPKVVRLRGKTYLVWMTLSRLIEDWQDAIKQHEANKATLALSKRAAKLVGKEITTTPPRHQRPFWPEYLSPPPV